MGNRRYLYSFITTVTIYSLFIYGAYTLNFKKEPKRVEKPKIVKIALIAPPTPPPPPKKEKPKRNLISKPKKPQKPKRIKKRKKITYRLKHKPKKRKIIRVKRDRTPKRIVKKRKNSIKHNYIKRVVKRVNNPTPKPAPTPKEIIEEYKYARVEIEPKKVKRVIKTSKRFSKEESGRRDIITPTPKQNIQNSSSSKKNLNREKSSFLSSVREAINSNKIYPRRAKKMGIEGAVRVTFDIDSNGNVLNIRASNAPNILKKAVIRAVKNSFPVNIPYSLKSLFPLRNISVKVFFRLE